jgi:hypothetical protein
MKPPLSHHSLSIGCFSPTFRGGDVKGDVIKQLPDRIKNKQCHGLMEYLMRIRMGYVVDINAIYKPFP